MVFLVAIIYPDCNTHCQLDLVIIPSRDDSVNKHMDGLPQHLQIAASLLGEQSHEDNVHGLPQLIRVVLNSHETGIHSTANLTHY